AARAVPGYAENDEENGAAYGWAHPARDVWNALAPRLRFARRAPLEERFVDTLCGYAPWVRSVGVGGWRHGCVDRAGAMCAFRSSGGSVGTLCGYAPWVRSVGALRGCA